MRPQKQKVHNYPWDYPWDSGAPVRHPWMLRSSWDSGAPVRLLFSLIHRAVSEQPPAAWFFHDNAIFPKENPLKRFD
ncbi:MAG: hypothetical protein NTV33_00565 [Coprothermobacterota bacterium]|nr:hypothetical protein [Coprothermobacterota bacterium]